ncbi:hypothetical protein HDU87_003875 [Geranomyces variabilis]|uniref:Uncharacterized protein n=1 Tax=Geranomyces variabilis TaxID=109894 RepID=A0AAD5TKS6_9FUNG|nr:hypothetical protein HDU87_003875 [Geranomyces variabilis]
MERNNERHAALALFAVQFFGDLTQESGGSDAVLNAAIDEAQASLKSIKAKVSSTGDVRLSQREQRASDEMPANQVFLLNMAAPKDEKTHRSALRGEFRCALYAAGVSAENLRHMSYSTLLKRVLKSHDYVFIDDAQRWYSTPLMEDLIKGNESRARVVFFASLSPEASELPTPAISGRLSWSDFKLEQAEQDDFHDRVIN